MDLDEIKEYLHIKDVYEDLAIPEFIKAAESALYIAGIKKCMNNDLYSLAVKMLVAHFYENKDILYQGKIINTLPFGLQAIVNQLHTQQGG